MSEVLVVVLGASLFMIVMGGLLLLSALARESEQVEPRARNLNGQSSPDYGYGRHKRVR